MTFIIDRRQFLATLPALTALPALAAQAPATAAPLRVNGLSQLTLSVSDVKRSLDFYQALFGMPIQARQGAAVFLRIGSGPRFLALRPTAPGERPGISAFGLGVEGFRPDRVMKTLSEHGVATADAAAAAATSVGPMQARLTSRKSDLGGATNGTPEIFVGDPSGIVFQLQDVSYCGGGGEQGNVCRAVEAAPAKGLLAVRDMSHFTINVADQEKTVAFYQGLFGFDIQARQGTAPAYGVGPGVHFLMFTGGGPGRGGPPRGAGAGAPTGVEVAGQPGGAPGRGGAPAVPPGPRIDHACLSMDNFNPEAVTKTLSDFGIKPQQGQARDPLVTYISLRMPNRGGAEGGTPELYLTDPDGLAIQLQDVKYCGGGGFLGDIC